MNYIPILIFRSLNIRTAQHSDVEHIDIIVQGNFQFSYDALQYEVYENFHHTKITGYTVYGGYLDRWRPHPLPRPDGRGASV